MDASQAEIIINHFDKTTIFWKHENIMNSLKHYEQAFILQPKSKKVRPHLY